MQSQLVFQEEKERERLRIQNLLLSQAEKPALEHFFKGKSELSVLDIGCNDIHIPRTTNIHANSTADFFLLLFHIFLFPSSVCVL